MDGLVGSLFAAFDFELDIVWASLLVLVVAVVIRRYFAESRRSFYKTRVQDEYTYIVVGAGAAGCAAASRLATKAPTASVLLLEGGPDNSGSMVPLPSYTHHLRLTPIDYNYKARAPYRDDAAQVQYTCGHATGGTSNLDWGKHFEGESADYAAWKAATNGCQGWEKKDVAPYFEEFLYDAAADATPDDGEKKRPKGAGPMTMPIMFSINRSPLSWGFIESCAAAGAERFVDYLENGLFGKKRGDARVFPAWLRLKRSSQRYLVTEGLPSRVHCRSGAAVVKITFDEKRAAATGVVIAFPDGTRKTITATGGVVLCAGAVGSPKVLMQSGIGAAAELKKRSIPVVVDSPRVGKGFRDTPLLPLLYQAKPNISNDTANIHNLLNFMAWYVMRRGPVLNTVCDTIATKVLSDGSRAVVSLVASGGLNKDVFRRLGLATNLGVFKEALTFWITVQPPSDAADAPSEGFVALAEDYDETKLTTQPIVSPQPNAPVEAFKEAIEFARSILASKPLCHLSTMREALDCTLFTDEVDSVKIFRCLYHPTPKHVSAAMRAAGDSLREQARAQATSTEYLTKYATRHAQFQGCGYGSCAMGKTIKDGVVDAHLKVHGVRGLWVADTSVIPTVISGGTTAVATVIGARCADFVLQETDPKKK